MNGISIEWIKNEVEMDLKNLKYVGGGVLDNFLMIIFLNELDKGIYLCIVKNFVDFFLKDMILGNF